MKKLPETTSASLHIMAMAFMLLDHLWGTVVPGNDWMTCIGRLAMPIFAFLLVEGYRYTSDLRRYAKRLLLFALVSEIPFNLAMGGSPFYPVHQNVMFSLLLSLWLIHCNERARAKGGLLLRAAVGCGTVIAGYVLGLLTMVDFHHAGILMALTFCFFRKGDWLSRAGQLACLWYICSELIGGYGYELALLGRTVFVTRQSFALLALIPIWLYRGRQGYRSKPFQYACYAFYPLHLLVLGLIRAFA